MSIFYTSTAHKTRKSASCNSNIRLVLSSTTSSYPHFSWHICEHGSDNLTLTFSSDTPDIFLTFLSDTFFRTFLQTYLLTTYLIYLVTSCNYFFDHSFWGPARHTQHAISRLGSSTPHCTRTIAVGVQHATLNLQCRGWGPARHTKLIRSRLGSSTPHRTHKIAVGVQHATLNWENASCNCGPARHTERRESQLIEEDDKGQEDDDEGGEGGEGEEGEEGGEGEGGGEESDIKSNNPHLTGGEIWVISPKSEGNVGFRMAYYLEDHPS